MGIFKRTIFTAFLPVFILGVIKPATAEVKTREVEYTENGTTLKGFLAWDDALKGKRPGVLVVHEWWGINDAVRERAKMMAGLGYVGFALDMYGGGESTNQPDHASKMMEQLKSNEPQLLARARAGLDILKKDEHVDPGKLAVVGYCFGGYVALKLAYDGEPLKAVASFHGALPVPQDTSRIKAKILICHGADDTFIPAKTIEELRAALDKGKIEYQFISYPGAVHAFTVKGAEKRGVKGLAYNEAADAQSWDEMTRLFSREFAK